MRAMSPHRLNGAAFALVVLALVFRLLVPQGTMVAAEAHGPALVICTGHGPLSAPHRDPARTKASPDCAFASHVTPNSAPEAARLAGSVAWAALRPIVWTEIRGRVVGLAAPPPPAVGPPAALA